MAMHIINDLSLAVGLEWVLHDSIKEANAALKGKKNALFARHVAGGECVQAIVSRADLPRKNRDKLRPGALMVAAVAPNALVYYPVTEDLVWVCAVRDGVPLHGFDAVVGESDAQALLSEAMTYIQGADLFGPLSGSSRDLPDVIGSVDKKTANGIRFVRAGLPIVQILSVVGIVGAAIAAYVGYQAMTEKMSQERSITEAIAAQMRSEEDKKRRLAEAQAGYHAQIEQLRRSYMDAVAPADQFKAWMGVLAAQPASLGGWMIASAECDLSFCRIKWFKKDARAIPSMTGQLPGAPEGETLDEVTRAVAVSPGVLVQWGVAAPTSFDPRDFAARIAWLKGATFSPGASLSPLAPPPPEGVAAITVGMEGSWTLSGDNARKVALVLDEMGHPGVFAESVRFGSFSGGVPRSIEINGKYRIHGQSQS
jgi:hypothetical protein